ncbi:hypothetical protein IV454_25225 [Massilia antarctica]|uniref:Uncharacterized protein n=1 Tax=Massilia antarctica TaxID=2765360 RepID=A0AA48WAD9_9BURK|nr:hypothetical protein [Massilia antarctica]QPI48777.1 hypothetical protein IV454_25225 [Massilia antarctica]
MSILEKLVKSLSVYAKDAVSVSESDIRKFVAENNILLREDHFEFLMRFGCRPGERLAIFSQYGGDFDFETLKWVYADKEVEMEPPPSATFFGSTFASDNLCIEFSLGKVFLYNSKIKYNMVHGSIDGFLLRCLVSTYYKDAFSNVVIERDLSPDHINQFRLKNADKKITEATCFEFEYDDVENQKIRAEYYFFDGCLIADYPGSGSLLKLSGGILSNIDS